jgi:hypothetical protein
LGRAKCRNRPVLERHEAQEKQPIHHVRDSSSALEAVEKYHAIEGGQQTLSKLAAYVTEIVRKEVED